MCKRVICPIVESRCSDEDPEFPWARLSRSSKRALATGEIEKRLRFGLRVGTPSGPRELGTAAASYGQMFVTTFFCARRRGMPRGRRRGRVAGVGNPQGVRPRRATCAGRGGISSSVGPSARVPSGCRSWRAGSCISGRWAPGPLATARAGRSCSRGSSAPPLTLASAAEGRRRCLRGPWGWLYNGTGHVAAEPNGALRTNGVAAFHGGKAPYQPGRSGALSRGCVEHRRPGFGAV